MIRNFAVRFSDGEVADVSLICHQNTIVSDLQKHIADTVSGQARVSAHRMHIVHKRKHLKPDSRILDIPYEKVHSVEAVLAFGALDEATSLTAPAPAPAKPHTYQRYVKAMNPPNGMDELPVTCCPEVELFEDAGGYRIFPNDLTNCKRNQTFSDASLDEERELIGEPRPRCYVYLLAVSNKIRLDKITRLADMPMAPPADVPPGSVCSTSDGRQSWQPEDVLQRYLVDDMAVPCDVGIRVSSGVASAAEVVEELTARSAGRRKAGAATVLASGVKGSRVPFQQEEGATLTIDPTRRHSHVPTRAGSSSTSTSTSPARAPGSASKPRRTTSIGSPTPSKGTGLMASMGGLSAMRSGSPGLGGAMMAATKGGDDDDEDGVEDEDGEDADVGDEVRTVKLTIHPLRPLRENSTYAVLLCRGAPVSPAALMEASFLCFAESNHTAYDFLSLFRTAAYS